MKKKSATQGFISYGIISMKSLSCCYGPLVHLVTYLQGSSMNIDQKTPYGGIDISLEAVASVAGRAASECYGVVGLAPKSKSVVDNVAALLKAEEFAKGVTTRRGKKGFEVDLYLYGAYDVKLTEVVSEVRKKVKYDLEKTFGVKFEAVNVYIQDIREREAGQ